MPRHFIGPDDQNTHASWDLGYVEAGYVKRGYAPRMTATTLCGEEGVSVRRVDDRTPTCLACQSALREVVAVLDTGVEHGQ